MGCGCGGSTPRQAQPAERDGARSTTNEQIAARRRQGGPGEPSYYWTGPKKQKPQSPSS